MAPAGSVYGMRNQSLAYTSANSMNRSFARSVVLASMSPKLVLRSSNDHHRVFGIPENETGVGIMVRTVVASSPVTSDPGTASSDLRAASTSRLYQSRRP